MANKAPRTTPCDAATRTARLTKARGFNRAAVAAAEADDDPCIDALITLYVHSGIASADVICCARLGKHAQGTSHDEATGLLGQVDKTAAKSLGILLGMKTKSGYSSRASTSSDLTRAQRASEALLRAASAL